MRETVRGLPFSSLGIMEPFTAVVIDKIFMQLEKERRRLAILILRKEDGARLAFTLYGATPREMAFMGNLETNRQYVFPQTYSAWRESEWDSQRYLRQH